MACLLAAFGLTPLHSQLGAGRNMVVWNSTVYNFSTAVRTVNYGTGGLLEIQMHGSRVIGDLNQSADSSMLCFGTYQLNTLLDFPCTP